MVNPNFGTFNRAGTVADQASFDVGLRAHRVRVYNYMASGLALSGIVAFGLFSSAELASLFFQVQAGRVVGMNMLGWIAIFAPLSTCSIWIPPRMLSPSGAWGRSFGCLRLSSPYARMVKPLTSMKRSPEASMRSCEALASLGRERKVVITVNQFFTAGRVVSGSDLLTVLKRPFYEHPAHAAWAGFPPDWADHIQISCSS